MIMYVYALIIESQYSKQTPVHTMLGKGASEQEHNFNTGVLEAAK